MSSVSGLTKRQVQVLWAITRLEDLKLASSGANLVNLMQASTLDSELATVTAEGIHQTAASLVRRKAVAKGHTGLGTVAYSVLDHGRWLLRREVQVHGRPL